MKPSKKKGIAVIVFLLLLLVGCAKDSEAPTITKVTVEKTTVTVEANDNVGVSQYSMTKENNPTFEDVSWLDTNVFTIEEVGEYFLWAKDSEGNISALSDASKITIEYVETALAPFESVRNLFNHNMMAVKDPSTQMWGYVDLSGNYVIDPAYDGVTRFTPNGIASVVKGGEGYVIDISSNTILGPSSNKYIITNNGLIFEEGTAKIFNQEGRQVSVLPNIIEGYSSNGWYQNGCTFYDYKGNVMLDYEGDWVCHSFVNGYAFIEEDGTYGGQGDKGLTGHYIDTTGNKTIEFFRTPNIHRVLYHNPSFLTTYGYGEEGEDFYFSEQGTAMMLGENDLEGYVDQTGQWIIEPKYYDAGAFGSDGLAIVTIPKGEYRIYGVINSKGDYVVYPKYNALGYYSNGLAIFVDNSGIGYLDTQGKVVIPGHSEWATARSFYDDGYAVVKNSEGLWAVIDVNGNYVTNFIYSGIK